MRFKRLEITNFGVFSEEQSFNLLPVKNLDCSKPIIIFGGKNGTGKTTLLEAFKICLYGNSFKGQRIPKWKYNKYVISRLHRCPDGSKSTYSSIALEFDFARVGFIDNFKVKRSWKFDGSNITESLEILQNNKQLKEVNEEQWQNFLMELIPPGLSKLFLFDGEKIQSLARGQGHNQHVIGSINSLLSLDTIEKLRYDIKTYVARESSQQKTDFNSELAQIQTKIKKVESEIDSILQKKASLENKITRVNLEIQNQELTISSEGGGFASKREEHKEKEKAIEAKIESTKDNIRFLCANLLPFSIVPELCLSLKKRLESEEKEQQRQAAMTYLNDAVDDLPTDFANTLILGALKLTKEEKQLVAQEAIKALKNNIQKINGNCKKYVHEVSSLERSDLLRWIELAISKTPSELKDLSYSLKTLEAEAEVIKGYLFNAPSDELLKPLFSKLGKLHEELGHFAQEQVSQENKYQTAINQLKALKTEHDNLFNEKIHFDKQNLQVKLAIKSQKVLEEYLELSRAEKINEFKENFLECFNLLIGKQNMVGDANISQLNFNIELLSPRGIPIAKSELSAGERQIYAMAMIWSLAKTSGRALPFIIDTPLGRFDSDHRNNVLENFLSNASHQMIIFSTNTEVDKPYFNQLKPYIAKAYNLEYDSSEGKTVVKEGYFWDILEGNN